MVRLMLSVNRIDNSSEGGGTLVVLNRAVIVNLKTFLSIGAAGY